MYNSPPRISARVEEIHKLEGNFREETKLPSMSSKYLNNGRYKNIEKKVDELMRKSPQNLKNYNTFDKPKTLGNQSEKTLLSSNDSYRQPDVLQNERKKLGLSFINTKKLQKMLEGVNIENNTKQDLGDFPSNQNLGKNVLKEYEHEYTSNDISLLLGKSMSLDLSDKNSKIYTWSRERLNNILDTNTGPLAKLDKAQNIFINVLSLVIGNIFERSPDEGKIIQMIWNTHINLIEAVLTSLPTLLQNLDPEKLQSDNYFSLNDFEMSLFREDTVTTSVSDSASHLQSKLKSLEEKLRWKEILLRKSQEETLKLLAEQNQKKAKTNEIISENDALNRTRSSQIPQRTDRAPLEYVIKSKPGNTVSSFVNDPRNKKTSILQSNKIPLNEKYTSSRFKTEGNFDSEVRFEDGSNALKYYMERNGQSRDLNSKKNKKVPPIFVSIGVNTTSTTKKDSSMNTHNFDSLTSPSKLKNKITERAVDTSELILRRHVGTQSETENTPLSVQFSRPAGYKTVFTDTSDLKNNLSKYIQCELDEKVNKATDTVELVKTRKLKKQYEKNGTERNFDEELFTSKLTDTFDLILKQDKQITVSITEPTRAIEVQTDLRDIVDVLSMQLNLSPMLPHKKGKYKEKDDNYAFTLKKLEETSDLGPVLETQVNLKANSYQRSHEFEELFADKIDMKKELEGISCIKPLVFKAQSEIYNNFESLKEFIKKELGKENMAVNELEELVEKNINCVGTHLNRISERDLEIKLQMIDVKMRECERELELKEFGASVSSWKKRFNHCFDKYKNLKVALETPQENEFFINAESKMKFAQEIAKEGSFTSGSKPNLTIINEQVELTNRTSAAISVNKLRRRNTLNSESALSLSISKSVTRNSKGLKKQPSGYMGSIIENEKDYINVESLEKKQHQITKGHLVMSSKNLFQNRRKILRNIESVNGMAAIVVISKMKELPIVGKDFLGLESLCKIISGMYTEIIKQEDRKKNDNPLYFAVYDFLLNRYGSFPKNAEEKIINIIRTSVQYQSYPRINMFLRLMTIIDDKPYEYDGRDLNYYMWCLTKLDDTNKLNPGFALAMSQSEKNLIYYRTANNFVSNLLNEDKSLGSVIQKDEIIDKLKANVDKDYKSSAVAMIDCDFVIQVIFEMKFEYYQKLYRIMFDTVDLEKRELLNFESFLTIYRTISKSSYTLKKALSLWKSEYDIIDEDHNSQECISFRYFSLLAEKNKLFTFDDLDNFKKGISDLDIKNLEDLKSVWPTKKATTKLKLLRANKLTLFMKKILEYIENYVNNDWSQENKELVWLRYRIIDEEANNGFLDSFVKSCIPATLNDIAYRAEFYI